MGEPQPSKELLDLPSEPKPPSSIDYLGLYNLQSRFSRAESSSSTRRAITTPGLPPNHSPRAKRLSNLRVNASFDDHLCMKVSDAFARVGALDFGLKVLWKHNVYGITPTIGSAHYLLQHGKEHNDTELMERTMQVLRGNSLPLQPGTADIVFNIFYNAKRWALLSKYAARFVRSGSSCIVLHLTFSWNLLSKLVLATACFRLMPSTIQFLVQRSYTGKGPPLSSPSPDHMLVSCLLPIPSLLFLGYF